LSALYLDSSAIVKLIADEPGSEALRRYLRRRSWLVTSALSRAEVGRALIDARADKRRLGERVFGQFEVLRVNDRILRRAAMLPPPALRTLDAVHLASAETLAEELGRIVTYDDRMAASARALGFGVAAPG
jgi:predicted nucleic acid-binding protein